MYSVSGKATLSSATGDQAAGSVCRVRQRTGTDHLSQAGRHHVEQASTLPIAGLTALQALRDLGHIAAGHEVLINGAAGGVGHFAVQIARIFGAARVTAVCSGAKADLVQGLGADRVIDYTREDFTNGTRRYNIIFDAVSKRSFADCKRVLALHGRYVNTLPSFPV